METVNSVCSGRVTQHIQLLPASANGQQTASGDANMICSLHSFNGVVVPSFSLRIVCEPRALATASTGGLSAEGTGKGKPSPLGTVPNGAPEVTRSPFENIGLRFQKAASLGEGKGPKRGARRMATEVGAAG